MAASSLASAAAAVAIVGFLAPRTAPAQYILDLNPATHSSASGRVTLFVDPTDRDGAGPADYELAIGGKLAWKGRRPITLQKAVITEDGTVFGWAVSHGAAPSAPKEIVLATIAPNGDIVAEDRIPHKPHRFLHQGPLPRCMGLLLLESNTKAVACIRDFEDVTQFESWWLYDLKSGKRERSIQPKPTNTGSARVEFRAGWIIVPGTSLILTDWVRSDWRAESASLRGGSHFTLSDLDGRLVWESSFAAAVLDWSLVRWWPNGTILDSGAPRRFTIRALADWRDVTYSVEADTKSPSRWHVEEISNRAASTLDVGPPASNPTGFNAGGSNRVGFDSIPKLPVEPRASITLARLGESSIVDVAIDANDRIYLLDTTHDAIHVLDREGKPVREIRLPERSKVRPDLFRWLSVNRKGEVLIPAWIDAKDPEGRAILELSATGDVVEEAPWEGSMAHWYWHSREGLRWVVDLCDLYLVDSKGAIRSKVERSLSRKWLGLLSTAAVAPDGSIVVNQSAPGPSNNTGLHVFGPDGSPLRTLPTRELMGSIRELAFDGKRIWCVRSESNGPDAVVAIDAITGGTIGAIRMPEERQIMSVFVASEGREFWIVDTAYRLERYSIPASMR